MYVCVCVRVCVAYARAFVRTRLYVCVCSFQNVIILFGCSLLLVSVALPSTIAVKPSVAETTLQTPTSTQMTASVANNTTVSNETESAHLNTQELGGTFIMLRATIGIYRLGLGIIAGTTESGGF